MKANRATLRTRLSGVLLVVGWALCFLVTSGRFG
jgi:hypothetical protein